MKVCRNCRKWYDDECTFCNACGMKLGNQIDIKKLVIKHKNLLIAATVVFVVAILGIGFTLSEQKKIHDTKQAMDDYKMEKAMEEFRTTPTISDIKINSGWETERSRNYIYIRGSVTNTSKSKEINYFEVEAKFYDSNGNVVDSDWTNGVDLGPNETKKFEIMHKYDYSYEDIKLSIKDVS